ncbi:FadR/GntR family transcriptional regulator [Desulfitobacterium hafniense]|uniref:HTH gntR-type domain-containing protein n=1 Tax=Desulfitobacterium hafniense (strain Y51) TaxID=138119 RepID=Q24NJ9_DESHY|nr:GntR family transcriptional regulator [Desulfitobacterium hafniense]BAE86393.1 hypothetical protein DSY4604 [Desulfitobacterium hafniense Y51]
MINSKQVLTLAEQVALSIKDSILDGLIGPGDQLPGEYELSTSFGVSRPTIRLALDILYDQKILVVRRGRGGGHFVNSQITDECLKSLGDCFPVFAIEKLSFEELKEARDVIQIMGSQLAAQRRTTEDLARIHSSIPSAQDMHTCDFSGKLVNFQVELVKASYNNILLANTCSIARTLRMVFLKLNLTDDIKKEYIVNMETIYESLIRKDHLKVVVDMRVCLNYCNGVIREAQR